MLTAHQNQSHRPLLTDHNADRRSADVIPFPDRGRHFDPGCPVPARIGELHAAVLDGDFRAEHAAIVKTILRLLKPDRDRNWRTPKPTTHALIAELHGCKPRTVKTALLRAREQFGWFNWRKVEGGIVFKMRPDGTMIGKIVARSDAGASNPKETPRSRSFSKERTETVSSGRRALPPEPTAVAERLARWLAELPTEVVGFGVSLGLKRREVLAVAERFAKYYTAHPEKAPADFTGAFCGHVWLERDAERKAARRGNTVAAREPEPVQEPSPPTEADRIRTAIAGIAATFDIERDHDHVDDRDDGPVEHFPDHDPDPHDYRNDIGDDEDAWRHRVIGNVPSRAELIAAACEIVRQHQMEMAA